MIHTMTEPLLLAQERKRRAFARPKLLALLLAGAVAQ
jgi:hypothetical protein